MNDDDKFYGELIGVLFILALYAVVFYFLGKAVYEIYIVLKSLKGSENTYLDLIGRLGFPLLIVYFLTPIAFSKSRKGGKK